MGGEATRTIAKVFRETTDQHSEQDADRQKEPIVVVEGDADKKQVVGNRRHEQPQARPRVPVDQRRGDAIATTHAIGREEPPGL
jgi:hypothetical protein